MAIKKAITQRAKIWLTSLVFVAFSVGTAELAAIGDADLARGTKDTSGWYHYGGNWENWRHSELSQINRENVNRLLPVWIFQSGIPGQLVNSPIVADGVLFFTSAHNHLWALDSKTGEALWHYAHDLPSDLRICCGPATSSTASSVAWSPTRRAPQPQ